MLHVSVRRTHEIFMRRQVMTLVLLVLYLCFVYITLAISSALRIFAALVPSK